eukprot:NODE_15027_length_1072_cov_3.529101.p1 GENE.NODE_15027_length_1072_cov_3.529101~~NODE_15027_length_1072_cov_3.529101.p1  ORF type:complete len:280 (+),score=79.48 NODE_15027_length_1072_cov_3.529101:44-883(+)
MLPLRGNAAQIFFGLYDRGAAADVFAAVLLLVFCPDLCLNWNAYRACHAHTWLLASYLSVALLSALNLAGAVTGHVGFLVEVRQKRQLPRCLALVSWCAVVPCLCAWTALGTFWQMDIRASELPAPRRALTVCWVAVLHVWLGRYFAMARSCLCMELRVHMAERELRRLFEEEEDNGDAPPWWDLTEADTSYSALLGSSAGLAAREVAKLLHAVQPDCGTAAVQCAICLAEVKLNTRLRRLPGCGHTFHCSCIALWLLRRAECPLCKRSVMPPSRAHQD